MRPNCAAGSHEAGPRWARNGGLDFGRCRKCRRALVRPRGRWRTVPKGLRVVWRPASTTEIQAGATRRLLNRSTRPGRRKSRLAVAAELAALGAHCLAWALADRLKAWVKGAFAPRPPAKPALGLAAR